MLRPTRTPASRAKKRRRLLSVGSQGSGWARESAQQMSGPSIRSAKERGGRRNRQPLSTPSHPGQEINSGTYMGKAETTIRPRPTARSASRSPVSGRNCARGSNCRRMPAQGFTGSSPRPPRPDHCLLNSARIPGLQIPLAGRSGGQIGRQEAAAQAVERLGAAEDQLPAPMQPIEHGLPLIGVQQRRIGVVPEHVSDARPQEA